MAARRAFLSTCPIKGLTNSRSRLVAALLAAWIVVLNVSSAHASGPVSAGGQRCYMCGPGSMKWFEGGGMLTCDSFIPTSVFEMDCGPGYNYCVTIYDHKTKTESRACTKELTETCTGRGISNTNVLSVCSCNGTLCNRAKLNIPQLEVALRLNYPITSTEKADDDSHEKIGTTTKQEIVTESSENKHDETTVKPESSEHEEAPEEPKLNKTKDTISKVERDAPNQPEEHKNTVHPAHTLPLPEALGQENKKKPEQHGAPVDDEEDTSEGSGSHMESDNKSHRPTTTRITYKQPETTTTQTSKNQGGSVHSSIVVSLIIWSVVARFILV